MSRSSRTQWVRSSHCESGACLEVRREAHSISVRDAGGRVAVFTPEAWRDFITAVSGGTAMFSMQITPATR
jgi:hypothetical protein